MDDRLLRAESAAQTYRCPGQDYDIDRSVHLGRLAAFYPACRQCEHRHDVSLLSPLAARQWAEVEARQCRGPSFTAEGLEGASHNDVGVEVVRRFATALAVSLWHEDSPAPRPPAVLVGSDGHWTTAELLSAACEALRLAGCRTMDAGAVTSPALAAVARHFDCDAALLVGNSSGEPHAKSLKLWGRGGRPWSSPGGLDRVREIYQSKVDRPQRRGATLERSGAAEIYLPPLGSLFHALRPLRLVVDTTCQPLLQYLNHLGAEAACEVLRPKPSRAVGAAAVADAPLVTRRLGVVGRQVIDEGAHFELWIDGDAEACRLVDQLGVPVSGERLCLLLADYVCREQPTATLVVEPQCSAALHQSLERLGARVVVGAATREGMSQAIESSGALLAGGPSGRFWFAGKPAAPDALLALSLLLTILSSSDRPLSEVLDAL